MFTLSEWIRHEFGSQEKLEEQLGLGNKTVSSWVTRRPRQFLTRLDFFVERGTEPMELLKMVQQREQQMAHIRRTANFAKAATARLREDSAREKEGGLAHEARQD